MDYGKCPICKKEFDVISFGSALAYWGVMIYKIIQNKPMTKSEQEMMKLRRYLDKDKCFVCRRKNN